MIERIKKFFADGAPKKCLAPFKTLASLFAHNFLQKFLSSITALPIVSYFECPTLSAKIRPAFVAEDSCSLKKLWSKWGGKK